MSVELWLLRLVEDLPRHVYALLLLKSQHTRIKREKKKKKKKGKKEKKLCLKEVLKECPALLGAELKSMEVSAAVLEYEPYVSCASGDGRTRREWSHGAEAGEWRCEGTQGIRNATKPLEQRDCQDYAGIEPNFVLLSKPLRQLAARTALQDQRGQGRKAHTNPSILSFLPPPLLLPLLTFDFSFFI